MMIHIHRLSLASLVTILSIGSAGLASGDNTTSAPGEASEQARRARARQVFGLGRTAMKAGRYAEAAALFEDSQTLDPAWGTLLNLAFCDEKLGKTATAWGLYLDAAPAARAERQDKWADDAEARAKRLEGSILHVVVRVDRAPDERAVEVLLDETPFPESLWGRPTAVDPGLHALRAKAPARRPWSTTFTVDRGGGVGDEVATITVPILEPAEVQIVPPTLPRREDIDGRSPG